MVAVILVSGVGSTVDYRKEVRFVEKRNESNAVKRVSESFRESQLGPRNALKRGRITRQSQSFQIRSGLWLILFQISDKPGPFQLCVFAAI